MSQKTSKEGEVAPLLSESPKNSILKQKVWLCVQFLWVLWGEDFKPYAEVRDGYDMWPFFSQTRSCAFSECRELPSIWYLQHLMLQNKIRVGQVIPLGVSSMPLLHACRFSNKSLPEQASRVTGLTSIIPGLLAASFVMASPCVLDFTVSLVTPCLGQMYNRKVSLAHLFTCHWNENVFISTGFLQWAAWVDTTWTMSSANCSWKARLALTAFLRWTRPLPPHKPVAVAAHSYVLTAPKMGKCILLLIQPLW